MELTTLGRTGLLKPGGTIGIYGMDDADQLRLDPARARGTFTVNKNFYGEAETHEPLFNRTYGRFCSHRNSPPRLEPSCPAIVRRGNVIHISQRIFRAYREFGVLLHRRLVENCLDLIHPDRLVEVDLRSAGEVCLTVQSEPKRFMVHLLYATPLKRGSVRVVEDVVDLFDIEIDLRSERVPTRVYTVPDEQPLDFVREGD